MDRFKLAAGWVADAVTGSGDTYRIGGHESCPLLSSDSQQRQRGLAAAAAALTADCEALRQILLESNPELDDHHVAVGRLAHDVAARLGIDADDLSTIKRGAELHDIGKIAIPDAILHKPGPLTDDEWQSMRRHTTIGERFLSSIPALMDEARLVRSSHERYDGHGYPDGLSAEQIPLGARIIFACDSYHAMITDRPYRTGMSHDDALTELRRHSGTQFDPSVTEALCAALTSPDSPHPEHPTFTTQPAPLRTGHGSVPMTPIDAHAD